MRASAVGLGVVTLGLSSSGASDLLGSGVGPCVLRADSSHSPQPLSSLSVSAHFPPRAGLTADWGQA